MVNEVREYYDDCAERKWRRLANPYALKEVEKAGFDIISYAGSESFLSGIINEVEGLADSMSEVYNNYVEAACHTCELPQFRDATEHLHIVAKRNF